MHIELLSITPDPEKLIERAGRTCYLSFDKITNESAGVFIRGAIKRGHESILEHASATFRVTGVSRALTHQLVRHRIGFSFSQQSQRYVKEDQFDYVVPDSIKNNKEFIEAWFPGCGLQSMSEKYNKHMKATQNLYDYFIKNGVKPEDARSILPNACVTEIVVTANFRAWRHFLKLRLDHHAQEEIRLLAQSIGKVLIENAPNVFHDLEGLIYA